MKGKLFTFAALLGAGVHSSAAVTSFAFTYYADYEQVSDAQPADTPYAAIGALIAADTDGDLGAANLISPLGEILAFYDASYDAGTFMLTGTGPYSSTADLVSAWPDGVYTFDLLGGNAAPQMATLNVTPADFADTIPYLDGGSFSAMQNWPSGIDSPVTWPAYANAGSTDILQTNFYLYDYTDNATSFYAFADSTSTGATIDGATMLSGHYYGYTLEYFCFTEVQGAGFGDALGYFGFSRRSSGLMHCKANPGTVAGKLNLSDYYYPSGQTVRVQVVDDDGIIEEEQDIILGSFGYYAFDTASTGVKTITFKGKHWLRKAIMGVDLDIGQDDISPTLINGDIDGDNSVTVFDYSVLSVYFDKSSTDPDWTTPDVSGFAPVDADLDGDTSVTVFDYSILSTSFDMNGD